MKSENDQPSRRRWRTESAFLALAVLLTALLAACGAPVATGRSEALECERLGYPCSFAEVTLDVLQQSLDLADDVAALLLGGGSVDEAMDMLSAVTGMASVEGNDVAVVFRLEGGRPTVVNPTIDQPLLSEDAVQRPSAVGSGMTGLLQPNRVVGGGGAKSALVLAAFPFDFGGQDSAAYIAELLATTPDYAGRVTFKSSPSADDPLVTVADLLSLDDHDLVYMTTHGGKLCLDKKATLKPLGSPGSETAAPAGTDAGSGDCRSDFLVQRFHGSAAELQVLEYPGIVLYQGSRHRSIAVTADFFRHFYPNGLGDTLFVLLSCSTYADDLAAVIGRGSTGFVSWDGMVDSVHAWATADLMEHMLLHGVTVAKAFEALEGSGFDPAHGGRLRASNSAQGMRLRDPLRVEEVFSGLELPRLTQIDVEGIPGDARPDSLLLEAEVQGLVESEAASAGIEVFVDGVRRLSGTVAQLGEQEDWARYGLQLDVGLGRDVSVGQPLAIEVVLTLPEGGSARVAGMPRVAGSDDEDLGTLWEGTMSMTYRAKAPGDEVVSLSTSGYFERHPEDGPDSKYPSYHLTGGTFSFSFDGTDGNRCTVTARGGGSWAARDSVSFSFNRDVSPPRVGGWGVSGTPSVEADIICPDGGMYKHNMTTSHTILNIPWDEDERVRGSSFSGSHRHESGLGVTIWTWSFRRVQ